jgi:hypothetical protein
MRLKLMKLIGCLLFGFVFSAQAQYSWGTHAFTYLNQLHNAKNAGVGGRLYALNDKEVGSSLDQPALLDASLTNQYHTSVGILPSGVHYGSLVSAVKTKWGVFAPYLRYMNYGSFNQTNTEGQVTGTFNALDYNIGTSYAYTPNPYFRIGAQLNLLGSHLERFSAFGFSTHFSALLVHPNQQFVAALGVRNAGFIFKDYTPQANSMLPLDVYAAVSYRLAHAPFRFHLVGHSLNRSQNIWLDPNAIATLDPLTGDTIPVYTPNLGEKIANHLHFQLELIPKGAIQIRMGFDYNRRQQLKLNDFPGLAGFSFGTRLHVKRFDLDYAVQFYSKAGSIQTIGLSTDLARLKKKI